MAGLAQLKLQVQSTTYTFKAYSLNSTLYIQCLLPGNMHWNNILLYTEIQKQFQINKPSFQFYSF